MKREKKLAILSAILAVCIAVAFVVSRIDFEEKMTGTETAIVDVESDEITYLAWNYDDDQMAFTCEDGKWSYESDEKMAVDQDLLDEIAENLSEITSDKMVEEVQSLSVYGLSDPAYHITIKTEEDTFEIEVGDETFSDGEVYISRGDDYVYLTDSGLIDDISYTLLDCVQKEEIPEMESISKITVDNEDSVNMIYRENAGYCYSDAYTYYLKDGNTYRNLDNENTKSAFATLSGFSWEGCVDFYAEDTELDDYGLLEPDAAVSITYVPTEEDSDSEEKAQAQTFEYEVGTTNDSYYAKLADSRIVYSISEDVFDAAVNASYEELKPDEVILLDWDTVDSIEIEFDGNVYRVGVEKDGDDAYKYTFNDIETEFDNILDQITGITIAKEDGGDDDTDVPEEEPSLGNNKAELKLTFNRNTEEYEKVELAFYQYDGTWCISVLNGEEMNYTDRASVVDLKEDIHSVILDSDAGH